MKIRQRILRSLSEIDSEVAGAGHPLQEENIHLLEATGGADDDSLFVGNDESRTVGIGEHSNHNHGHGHRRGGGMWNLLVGTARSRHQHGGSDHDEGRNPFDFGLLQNCIGFFSEDKRGPLRRLNWYAFYEAENTRTPHENLPAR
jgi:hypothetical protein